MPPSQVNGEWALQCAQLDSIVPLRMNRILLVDDDGLVIRSYRDRLSAHGFQVNSSLDANAAITVLRTAQPDLVVLDLMMPGLSGVEVLKFIRSEPRLATTPVVVLTNAYMNDLGRQAGALGVEKALLKSQCTPSVLMAVIDEILLARSKKLGGQTQTATPSSPSVSKEKDPGAAAVQTENQPALQPAKVAVRQGGDGSSAETRIGALAHGSDVSGHLRRLFQAFTRESSQEAQQQRLQDLYRKVHSLSAGADLAEYLQITQMMAVFEALLYVLLENPARIGPSTIRTVASLVDSVELLFQNARESGPRAALSALVLVVDDDPLSNRMALSGLQQAQLQAHTTEDPTIAWQLLNREHYDLFLLDIEMPGLNGFELCKRLRALPKYAKTPVIYVTNHSDFENRAKGTLSGGGDLIAKPILPIELAAKVMMHLMRSRVGAKRI